MLTQIPITGDLRLQDMIGNGIIVFAGPNDEFYAYDRTCPHDYDVNKLVYKGKHC